MAEHERPVVAFLGPEASYTHQVRQPTRRCIIANQNLSYGVIPKEKEQRPVPSDSIPYQLHISRILYLNQFFPYPLT
jgi:hypothetical protein